MQVRYHDIPEEGKPERWLQFMKEIFTDDEGKMDFEAMELLQEWFGYCFTSDTSRHKFMTLVGPPRAGKGLIAKILEAILGSSSTGSFDFRSISGDFGLEGMQNKLLAISHDVRDMTGEINRVLDVFLRMTAGDVMAIQRKGKTSIEIPFPAKMMILTNTVPEFRDAAGAVMSRMLVVQLQNSFVGRENVGLIDELKAELPGIVRWGLQGLQRLMQKGRFTVPESEAEIRQEILEASSPLHVFAKDCLVFDHRAATSKDWLYEEYKAWCTDNGFKLPKSKPGFYREFKMCFAGLFSQRQSSPGAGRVYYLSGVALVKDPHKFDYSSGNPPKGSEEAEKNYSEASPQPVNDIPF